ncbi:MAG: acetolactate synthase [Clostridia bacterium]|nr:acetolactate synthase [Clostridia bacterium]
MLIKQISVFVENKPGKLSEVIKEIGDCGIDIHALSMADTTDFGVLRLIVNEPEKVKEILKNKGMVVKTNEVIAIVVEDKPGGLAIILENLKEKGIGIEYIYAFIGKNVNGANVVMKVDKPEVAIEALGKTDVVVVPAADLFR